MTKTLAFCCASLTLNKIRNRFGRENVLPIVENIRKHKICLSFLVSFSGFLFTQKDVVVAFVLRHSGLRKNFQSPVTVQPRE